MQDPTASVLLPWASFSVIIGSAAAALTGLMFVVVTLIAGTRVRRSYETIAAFGTPTVIHFCAALLIAVILSAPWQALWNVALLLAMAGLGGMVYTFIVIQRARHQQEYTPVMEDWLWHAALPLVSYVALFVAAILLLVIPIFALFGVGIVTVLLLFIGIHNAWDTVTFIVIERSQPVETGSQD